MKLADRQCLNNAPALAPAALGALQADVPGWRAADGALGREFRFSAYRDTIAFVNAVAAIAEQQHHHPEMTVGHATCRVTWTTHSAGGVLTENDFICAAKVSALETDA